MDEEIVTKRGDRFILRRPSPQETIGGGWVIDPNGEKYRFGLKTIEELSKKKEGSPKDRIMAALTEGKCLSLSEIMTKTSLDEVTVKEVLADADFLSVDSKEFTLAALKESIEEEVYDRLHEFHHEHPMKQGLNKAELLQVMQRAYPKMLVEFVISLGTEGSIFRRKGQYLQNADFQPHIPQNWKKRIENFLAELKKDGLKVKNFHDYYLSAGIPEGLKGDLKRFLEEQGTIVPLDGQFYWHGEHFREAVEKLKKDTDAEFEVGDAKEVLGLSRKYMIPFLERLDMMGLTNRVDNKRVWRKTEY